MLRYTLTHDIEGSLTLTGSNLPVDADVFKWTITHSETYGSKLRKFSVGDKFHGDGKAFIDNIVEKYGWNQTLNIQVEMFDSSTYTYLTILTGIVNFSSYKKSELYTEVNFEDGGFQQKVMNRQTVEVDYQKLKTFDGGTVIPYLNELEQITIHGNSPDTVAYAVYPFKAFSRIIYSISGIKDAFYSSIIGRVSDGYAVDGKLAYRMLTNGRWIRQYDNTESTINLNLKDLFEALNVQEFLGLGFETIEGKTKVIVENRDYFFQQVVVATIETISDLEIEIDNDLMFTKIKAGYQHYQKEANDIGLAEVNSLATYATPLIHFKKDLNLISPIRADATSIMDLKAKPKDDNIPKDDNLDTENFIIDCVNNENSIESRELEGIVANPDGIYQNIPLYTNVTLSPARIIRNWGSFIKTCLRFDKSKSLTFQQNESLSKLVLTLDSDTISCKDSTDIPINELESEFVNGYLVKFNCTFDAQTIKNINDNPNGLIKFYNNLEKSYNFGWIKEISLNAVDKKHNVELWLASNQSYDDYNYILAEDGLPIFNEKSLLILTEQ